MLLGSVSKDMQSIWHSVRKQRLISLLINCLLSKEWFRSKVELGTSRSKKVIVLRQVEVCFLGLVVIEFSSLLMIWMVWAKEAGLLVKWLKELGKLLSRLMFKRWFILDEKRF